MAIQGGHNDLSEAKFAKLESERERGLTDPRREFMGNCLNPVSTTTCFSESPALSLGHWLLVIFVISTEQLTTRNRGDLFIVLWFLNLGSPGSEL